MDPQLENLEDEFYDLLDRIDAGDVTDLDTSWAGIIDALKKVPVPYNVDFGSIRDPGAAVAILCEACGIEADDVVFTLNQLQELLDQKSHESIDEDDLEEARELASGFEEIFLAFFRDKLVPLIEEGSDE